MHQDLTTDIVPYPYRSRRKRFVVHHSKIGGPMSQNGMVRPCSSPASEPNWQGGIEDKGARHVRETQQQNRRGWRLHRQVSRFFSLEDAGDVDANQMEWVPRVMIPEIPFYTDGGLR
jgi:hypothetical protein